MKTKTYIFGLLGSVLCLVWTAALFIASLQIDDSMEPAGKVVVFVLLLIAVWALYWVQRAREDERCTSGVLLIVFSMLLGFMPVTMVASMAHSGSKDQASYMFCGILGSIFMLLLLAGGILALVTRKKAFIHINSRYNVSDTFKKAPLLLAWIGGVFNAVIGIWMFVDTIGYYDYGSELSLGVTIACMALFALLSLVGAFMLYFNRLIGSLLLLLSGGILFLIFALISIIGGVFEGFGLGVVLLIAQLIVIVAGILNIRHLKMREKG